MHLINFPVASEGIGFLENPATGVGPEDHVFIRRMRLEAQGDVLENLHYKTSFEFARPERPEIRDAFLGFRDVPLFQTVLLGNQKRLLGLDAVNSSLSNVFLERPLAVEAFNFGTRRAGIASYGVTENQGHTWQLGVFHLEDLSRTARYVGNSLQLSANARLTGNPWYDEASDGRGYFHWGVAGMLARPDGDANFRTTNENEARFTTRGELHSLARWLDTGRIDGARWFETLGLEAMFNLGPFNVTGEFLSTWLQRDDPNLYFHGGYVMISYFLTGEHIPYERTAAGLGASNQSGTSG
jgi:phosphate-selective porin OprO and OprP